MTAETGVPNRSQSILPRLAFWMGVVCAVLAAITLAGWQLQIPPLIFFASDHPPMLRNTALAFLLAGLGVVAATQGRRVVQACGGLVVLLALAALGQTVFGFDLGIDNLGVDFQAATRASPAEPFPGRMAPLVSICVLFAGLALLLLTSSRRQWMILGVLLGAACAGVGLSVLLAYPVGAAAVYSWTQVGRIALRSAWGLALVGTAVIMLTLHKERCRGEHFPPWVSTLAGLVGAVLTLNLWWALYTQNRVQVERTVQHAANEVVNEVDARIDARILALERMANRWEIIGPPRVDEWRVNADFYVENFDFEYISWLDADGQVRWKEPERAVVQVVESRQAVERFLDMADCRSEEILAIPAQLPGGAAGLLLCKPLRHKGQFQGFLLGALAVPKLLSRVLNSSIVPGFELAVRAESGEIFRRGEMNRDLRAVWSMQRELDLEGVSWKVEVVPSEEEMDEVFSSVPRLALFGGMLMSGLLALTVFWAQRADAQSVAVERANRDLRESEEKFARAFRSSPDAITISTIAEGRFIEVNDTFTRLTGHTREETVGHTSFQLNLWANPRDRERWIEQLRTHGRVQGMETNILAKDGRELRAQLSAELLDLQGQKCVVAITRDITEQRRLEEQFRQAQKMEAVGRLAAGVAHDFNNLLMIILGYTELLRDGLPEGHPLRANADEVLKAGDRATQLTHQLLAFSRKQVMQPRVFDVNQAMTEMEKMLRRLIGEDVRLATIYGRGPLLVKADPTQIEQVVLNLVVNARDAMPSGGSLTIETQRVALDQSYAQSHIAIQPGDYILINVTDTGTGMDDKTRAHIFEPFFTTKGPDKGTGLGLATVYGIVKQSGGYIWVYSEPGRGASFKIYLPEAREAKEPRPREMPAPEKLQGTETILVVEDETGVLQLAREILASYGYTVLAASHGEEALALVQKHAGPIHMLLTDVILPGWNGREVAQRLVKLRPGIRVLYMSGYTENAIIQHGVLDPGTHLLQKPFTPGTLARRVREILDQS